MLKVGGYRWPPTKWMKWCALKICGIIQSVTQHPCRRRLTLCTIVFLPLTLLTGYFVRYPVPVQNSSLSSFIGHELRKHVVHPSWPYRHYVCIRSAYSSPWLYEVPPSFWIIAIPLLSVIAPAFMWPDIVRMYHYVKKRTLARKIREASPNELSLLPVWCADLQSFM